MKKITINKINEDIYYEKLDNGMDVYLYINNNIHNNYVTFTTKYGSVYNESKYNNKMKFNFTRSLVKISNTIFIKFNV